MPLRSRLRSITHPEIRTKRELVTYVVRVAVFCTVLAVAVDVANQLTFFISWEAAIRSWVLSACVASVIAVPVALAIARAHLDLFRAKQVVETLSLTDPLTGLLNRRAMLDPSRDQVPMAMALAIVDIDRFKSINDAHGHLSGDEVIRIIGRSMQAQLGQFGRVGRIGGEEFALVSSESVTQEMIEGLWDFRDRVEATPIVAGSASIRATVSIGLASRKGGQSFNDLFAEADRALYLAKASGRNRVVYADDLTAAGSKVEKDDADDAADNRRYRSRA